MKRRAFILCLASLVSALVLCACNTVDDPFRPGNQATTQTIENEWTDYQAKINEQIAETQASTRSVTDSMNYAIASAQAKENFVKQFASALSAASSGPNTGSTATGPTSDSGTSSDLGMAGAIFTFLIGILGIGTHLDNQRKDRAIAVAKGKGSKKKLASPPPAPAPATHAAVPPAPPPAALPPASAPAPAAK